MFILDYHEYPFWKDAKQIVSVLLKANSNAIRFPVIVWGNTYYNSSFLPKYPGLGERDLLEEIVTECRKYGIKVIPYNHLGGVIHREVYRLHPEWSVRKPDGSPERWHIHYLCCLNNPSYRSAYQASVREIVKNYDVDAMYFDGPNFYSFCFCKHCKRLFYERYGFELPVKLSWDDRSMQLFFRQRSEEVEKFFLSLNKEIKAVKDIPVLFNPPGFLQRRLGMTVVPERLMKQVEGGLVSEVHRNLHDYMEILAMTKAGVAMDGAAWCYCPPGPYESLVTHDSLDTLLFGFTYLTHGGTPVIRELMAFMHDDTGIGMVRELFSMMEKYENLYFDFYPVRFIALLYSRQTAIYYGKDDPEKRYNLHFMGAFKALTHSHQQFNFIFDEELTGEELKKYKVLFLANVACLSDEQVEAIKSFVLDGGGLIATQQTSLYDEEGYKREDFALKEVFGVSYEKNGKVESYGEMVPYLEVAIDHPVVKDFPLGKRIPLSVPGWTPEPAAYVDVKPMKGSMVVANLFLGSIPIFGEAREPSLQTGIKLPGVVINLYGKGRSVYLASEVERHYLRSGLNSCLNLLSNAVEWASGNSKPLEISAPRCVVTNLTCRGSRMALHVINYTGNMYETSAYKADYISTIRKLKAKVKVPPEKKVKEVSLL
ncbi:hypothetical protein CP083_06655, partial [Candidatus Bathyarchaeota archaeon B24-2]